MRSHTYHLFSIPEKFAIIFSIFISKQADLKSTHPSKLSIIFHMIWKQTGIVYLLILFLSKNHRSYINNRCELFIISDFAKTNYMYRNLTLDDKLNYLNKHIQQRCKQHNQLAQFFCSKNNCQHHTYLCQRCWHESMHQHKDQIYQFPAWIDRIIQKISQVKPARIKIFQTKYDPNKPKPNGDFNIYLNQLKRVYSLIQHLQNDILQLVNESKQKLISYIRKYQNYGESRLSSKIHLYRNPYILVNKINSERNDNFVKELKKVFRGQIHQPIDTFNPKYQFMTLQNKIKSIVSQTANQLFDKNQQIAKMPQVNMFQQGQLQMNVRPQKLFMKGDIFLVSYKQQTHIHKGVSKQLSQKLKYSLSKCSFFTTQQNTNFIGVNRTNEQELIICIYQDKDIGNFVFPFKMCNISLYFFNNSFIAFIGREQGKLTMFDIKNRTITATLQQAHNQKVQFIQTWSNQHKLFAFSKNSPVSVYQIYNRSQQIELFFDEEIDIQQGQTQLFTIQINLMIILSERRAILIFDLVSKMQYKADLNQICKPFDYLSVLLDNQSRVVIISHNKNDNFLYSWVIDKKKSESIKTMRVSIEGAEQNEIMQLSGTDLWLLRPKERQIKLYFFTLYVV